MWPFREREGGIVGGMAIQYYLHVLCCVDHHSYPHDVLNILSILGSFSINKHWTFVIKKELLSFFVECDQKGFGKTRSDVILKVEKEVSCSWWESFCRSHSNVTLR